MDQYPKLKALLAEKQKERRAEQEAKAAAKASSWQAQSLAQFEAELAYRKRKDVLARPVGQPKLQMPRLQHKHWDEPPVVDLSWQFQKVVQVNSTAAGQSPKLKLKA